MNFGKGDESWHNVLTNELMKTIIELGAGVWIPGSLLPFLSLLARDDAAEGPHSVCALNPDHSPLKPSAM